tara:strand:- start:1276 stop:1431 length:156 start_codon:yes stop_codon:yes gene_type:complete
MIKRKMKTLEQTKKEKKQMKLLKQLKKKKAEGVELTVLEKADLMQLAFDLK